MAHGRKSPLWAVPVPLKCSMPRKPRQAKIPPSPRREGNRNTTNSSATPTTLPKLRLHRRCNRTRNTRFRVIRALQQLATKKVTNPPRNTATWLSHFTTRLSHRWRSQASSSPRPHTAIPGTSAREAGESGTEVVASRGNWKSPILMGKQRETAEGRRALRPAR